jgi:hypothetical protein
MDLDPNFKAVEMLTKHGDSAVTQVEQILAMAPLGSPEWKFWGLVKNKLVSASSNNRKGGHRSSTGNG